MSLTAAEVIELLRLEPLPVEGGYYRQTYRADETLDATVLPERYGGPRAPGGAIYYLLHGDHFSALHLLLTDEIYHFYLGQPGEMLLLYPDGHDEVVRLGTDLAMGERVQVVVPHGVWQGSHLAEQERRRFRVAGYDNGPSVRSGRLRIGRPRGADRGVPKRADLIRALTREEGEA